ncbi:MAG: DUF1566 domain-containing protein [Pseudomonadota bacterium]|nr:DUF1566 domain-containing protein [Pseudomonadota bacterium]
MRRKKSFQLFILTAFMGVIFLFITIPAAVSEMTLNDNVNIEGELFLEGDGCGINFSDGSYQTTGAVPPWSQKISSGRFVLVLDDEAVLDRETGLVWERDTDDTTRDWYVAQTYCYLLEIGGRKGWRLPTIDELATLIDSTQSNPALPSGHPFTNAKSYYWSSTTDASSTNYAWHVYFYYGDVGSFKKSASVCSVRAVRSGQ